MESPPVIISIWAPLIQDRFGRQKQPAPEKMLPVEVFGFWVFWIPVDIVIVFH
jgi:hypothetical protein